MLRSLHAMPWKLFALPLSVTLILAAAPAFIVAGQPVEELVVEGNGLRALLLAGAQVQSELTTLDVVVEVNESVKSYKEVWLAGLASNVTALDAVAVRWKKRR